MIVIVDYGRGNLFSIGQAMRQIGVEFHISGKPEDIAAADGILFPGVGAFGDAMEGLRSRGLVEALRDAAEIGKPLLGICVGCQLLLTQSEEFGIHDGLDLIPGTVSRLPPPQPDDPDAIRLPNVGWRPVNVREDTLAMGQLKPEDWMYFVHSYAPMVEGREHVAATIEINRHEVPVAICRDNILGVQFHPEKSGPAGLRLLSNFFESRLVLK